ncbi:MAG: hypothetical protein KA785_05795 [Spirochaetaceae bacterium]|nr:hypothetical protein [Spirochaetaceae bacterium]
MQKVFLFDIDGVIIRIPSRYSLILEKSGYLNATAALDKFYTSDAMCTIGKVDPLDYISTFLPEFGWMKGSKSFFDEQFEYESKYLDINLLKKIQALRNNGRRCYLATDQNNYRKEYLLHKLDLKSKFDGWFVSAEIGYRKIENEYWDFTISRLKEVYPGIRSNEIIFIDDREENIEKAKEFSINTFHVKGKEEVNKLMKFIDQER